MIGVGVDRVKLEETFDAAIVTEAEYRAGPEAWAQFADPLPPWQEPGAADGEDDEVPGRVAGPGREAFGPDCPEPPGPTAVASAAGSV